MTIAVVYVYPQVKMRVYYPLAKRFAETWKQYPPRIQHSLYVVLNGSEASPIERSPFRDIPCNFTVRNNSGWDIGAFQWAADSVKCDLLVCLGAPVYFYRPGWLEAMADSFIERSPALFGCWGVPYRVMWHIRTTAFWLDPMLLQSYPFIVGNARSSRYDFEHGHNSITGWAEQCGFDTLMVTFDGVYEKNRWGEANGGQDHCLVLDQFTHGPNPPYNIHQVRVR